MDELWYEIGLKSPEGNTALVQAHGTIEVGEAITYNAEYGYTLLYVTKTDNSLSEVEWRERVF